MTRLRYVCVFVPLVLITAVVACAKRAEPSVAEPPAGVVLAPAPVPQIPDEIPMPREVPPREVKEPDATLAFAGRILFLKLQCVRCHSATPEGKAPLLDGLYGTRVQLKGGGAEIADDAYIVESIRKPRLKVVEGWEAIMPAYDDTQASAEDLNALVAYIKSLKKGDPKANGDRFPPPNGPPK